MHLHFGCQNLRVSKWNQKLFNFQVISAEGHVRGLCLTPDWALNPLRLNAVNRSPSGGLTRQSRWADSTFHIPLTDDADRTHVRTYRDQSRQNATRSARSILPGVRKRQQEIIKCGQESPNLGVPVCATVRMFPA